MRLTYTWVIATVLFVGLVCTVQSSGSLGSPREFSESLRGLGGAMDTNVPPFVEISADLSSGKAPLRVRFDGNAWDQDGEIASLEWDFEGDGLFEVVKRIPKELKGSQRMQAVKQELLREYTFVKPGIFHVLAKVTDDKGSSSVESVTIQVYSDTPYLDVVPCNSGFEYMARARYEAFFDTVSEKGVQFRIGDAWITYKLGNQLFGEVSKAKGVPEGNVITYSTVYPGVNIRYTVHEDLLLEEFIVQNAMSLSVIEQSFTIHDVEYKMNEDGSISFYNGEDKVFSIPRPVMYELHSPENKSYGLHYEITEQENEYVLRKIIDDTNWLQTARYPVVIDSSTQGDIADPWEQQGLTPYGKYFKNLNEYVDSLTGHLTIRHTDYTLPGRGLDLMITRVYTTMVAFKQKEDGSGEYVPVSTYIQAPTDLGCGWSLDFPWLDVNSKEAEKYLHLPNGTQIKTNFINGVWQDHVYGFTMYKNGDNTYTKYRDDGIREDYDNQGRIVSITDLNGNVMTFMYGQIGYSETGPKYGLIQITDTVGRMVNFSYSAGKLMSLSDGVRTTTYNYSGDRLVSVTDPLERVTMYDYMAGNSFLITGVHYPTGGFSTYEYTTIAPERAKLAPYKSSQTENGVPVYYVYKADSPDTVTWTSPKDIYSVTSQGRRPCVLQRDDGSLVMYFKDTYVWTEEKCEVVNGEYVCNTITHTEYWLKRSVSQDQKNWSSSQNVLQVKNSTGNPVVIEKHDGSYVMYYMDTFVWTEQKCEWVGCPRDCDYVCNTITHTEYWIYRRTSSDGIIWGASVKTLQTSLGVRNIAAIQKNDSTFLLCYTDKVGTSYYIRQITSTDGLTWSTPSNVVQVDSGTGNPALIQKDTGEVYVAYRKNNNYVYVQSNTGQGWSSPVQTTAQAIGDPSFLATGSDLVLIYKGTNEYFYRISSTNGTTWSSPSQIAPQKAYSDPSTVFRRDLFYRISAQYISASELDLVRVTEFSYEGEDYVAISSDVIIRDFQTVHSSMHLEFDSEGRTVQQVSRDEQGVQVEKICYTYNSKNEVIREDVYAGTSAEISYSVITGYDDRGNTVYFKDPEGTEYYYSYANTCYENQFVDSKGVATSLFSDQFYTNSVPSHCHTRIVGESFIIGGKVREIYYKYDSNGNMVEKKTLFPTRDYNVFSGLCDETGQMTFEFDLTGLDIADGILVISSIAVPTLETLHETHSEVGNGWWNTGTWDGEYFKADYLRCTAAPEQDCFEGQIEIGPFEHYPGTPNYTGYTKWVEDNRTQHVQTNYTAIINEYPVEVEYKLNNSSWTIVTSNLGSGATSTSISASSFVPGLNTLQFQETNTYSTKLMWTLYINQGATPEGYIASYTVDSYGNQTSTTDAEGGTRIYSYSADYNYAYVTSITNDLGNTTSISYDFDTGYITSVTTRNGNTFTYEYDFLGRITKKINPDLSELEADYDDTNNCLTVYDELDNFFKKYYDGIGRLATVGWYHNGQLYATETRTYNYLDKIVTKIDPGGNVYTYEYDSRGNTTKITNPDGTFRQIQYNYEDATEKYIDENGHYRILQYDWIRRLTAVKDYINPATFYLTQYEYDQMGNLTKMIDANGNMTQIEYGSLFGPTLITYPDGTTRSHTYDKAGNVITLTDGNGTTTYTYDGICQRTSIRYPDQSTVQFTYDANGNRLSVVNDNSTVTYTYDNRDWLISETQHIDGVNYAFGYTYDVAGQLTSITYPDGTVISRSYDDLRRVTSIGDYAQLTYYVDSSLETMAYKNGVTTTFDYDQRHRPASIAVEKGGTNLLNVAIQYDSVGNVVQLTSTWQDPFVQQHTATESFGYDPLNRLISASNGYGALSFSYDPVGNRISLNDLTYTYNNMNELLSMNNGEEYHSFTYDANGNTLSKVSDTDEWLHHYDDANRLTEVQYNTQTVGTYVYNGDGERIKKTEWSRTSQQYESTIYIYSGGKVYYEKNITTGLDALYVYGPTGRIAKKVGDEIMYYHTDHSGSTRLMTDVAGHPVTAIEYHPFGNPELTGENEHYLFTGQEMDSTGLYYYKNRYYDPEIGRFITRDVLRADTTNPQSLNRYTYCLNNPLKYVDPYGMESEGSSGSDDDDDEDEDGPFDPDKTTYTPEEMGIIAGYAAVGDFNTNLPCGESAFDPKIRELARQVYPDDPDAQEEFCKGYKEGWEKGKKDAAEGKYDLNRSPVFNQVRDLLMTCLKIVATSYPTPIPYQQLVELDAALTALDAYKTMDDALEEANRISGKENPEEGTFPCNGTVLLSVFCALAVFMKTLSEGKK